MSIGGVPTMDGFCVSIGGVPTMDGFEWSPALPYIPMEPGEDGWCVRNAFCALFGWTPDSDEWWRFREGPVGRDVARLAERLGLTEFQIPREWDSSSTVVPTPASPGSCSLHTARLIPSMCQT